MGWGASSVTVNEMAQLSKKTCMLLEVPLPAAVTAHLSTGVATVITHTSGTFTGERLSEGAMRP